MKKLIFTLSGISVLVMFVSCKKFLKLDAPPTSITKSEVYSSASEATATVSYIFYDMTAGSYVQGTTGLGVLSSLSSDELTSYSTTAAWQQFAQNAIQTDSQNNLNLWSGAYADIYRANLAIQNIQASSALSVPVKNQLIGECKFVRAFNNFYLLNLYGKIPLVLTTDYQANTVVARSAADVVYQSVIADLKDAQSLLSDNYLSYTNATTTDRIRPNRATATALLARVYLYTRDWANAEAQATTLINNTTYILEPNVTNVFLKTSKEAIWELQSPTSPYYTQEGNYYILTGSPIVNAAFILTTNALSQTLLNTFETGDKRRTGWVNSFTTGTQTFYYPYKYKSSISVSTTSQENLVVFRLAEQYLIRAEARAMQNKLTGSGSAAEDINTIRARAGLLPTTATTAGDIMLAIEKERELELFTEMGHRWLDLKRWKGFSNTAITRADEVMPSVTIAKGGKWDATRALFPIPVTELSTNPKLDQNPGY